MCEPLEIHTYDGKIDNKILPELEAVRELPLDVKIKKGQEIRRKAEETFKAKALYYLDGIIGQIGTNNNIDPTNMLDASDILCICWLYKDNEEFMNVLEVQLEDMETGFCPQGRTHRLFQTVMAFM